MNKVTNQDVNINKETANLIAFELNVSSNQVQAAIDLLDGGATVPFIARYRKEATGCLDDIQLRLLEVRLVYLRELAERRLVVVNAIHEQGKLTSTLQHAINQTQTKQELEDLYLPFKLKRRTKGQMAQEAGLVPLAEYLFANPNLHPLTQAQAFTKPYAEPLAGEDKQPNFSTPQLVLDGVRDWLSERWAEDAILVQALRTDGWADGQLQSVLLKDKDPNHPDHTKFNGYFDYQEPLQKVPSHRALAVLRGRAIDVLSVSVVWPLLVGHEGNPHATAESKIARHLKWQHQQRAGDDFIKKCVTWTWKVKLQASIERDLLGILRGHAEAVAMDVFANNLRDLLLAAPAGAKAVLGLDPGIRTGVKVAVVDVTGKLVETATVFPHEPRKDWHGSIHTLVQLCQKHNVALIAIGNGTGSRETDALAADVIEQVTKLNANQSSQSNVYSNEKTKPLCAIQKIVVSEAGASVYSASELASAEMPDVDVSLRGAASIARRLQDPLAELVKIDPKAIGVGQYQHDLNPTELARKLGAVVEDCVNAVGVDLNTASAQLLAKVSGLSHSVAKSVVRWREANGAFDNRQQLLKVAGLGAKAFEQAAGFLRIRQGSNPLDATGVHPESYPLVQLMLDHQNIDNVQSLMGAAQTDVLRNIKEKMAVWLQKGVGESTVLDIIQELEKPGRDPRPHFQVVRFNAGINTISDLEVGMVLEGTVSNVAAFGAFVDIGAHQDGLVHVSQLSHQFTTDARSVVKTGQVVKVQVLEVDVMRKRIGLTLKIGVPVASGDNFQRQNTHAFSASASTAKPVRPNVNKSHKIGGVFNHVPTAMEQALSGFVRLKR